MNRIMRLPYLATIFAVIFFSTAAKSQTLTQTIRGTIIDADSKNPIIGASIFLLDSMKNKGARTDVNGDFILEKIPIGRTTIRVTSVGYEKRIVSNIVVTSGKEIILNLTMTESMKKLKTVKISSRKKGKVSNQMSLVSGSIISVEETQRFAGSFNDPARMVSALAGVSGLADDANNDIIVRGNSPKYVQWRLDGIEIPNPNHFSYLGGSGGAISALNSDLLATSDFYSGAFSADYGNVLSGVMDMKLRKGNNKKREYSFGFGLLGIDATLEGPFKKGYRGSYLVNYRYSTLSLADNIGVYPGDDGIPKYQDGAFKLFLPTKKFGIFSIYGIGGLSGVKESGDYEQKKQIDNDLFMNGNIDYISDYKTNFWTSAINHTYAFSDRTYLQSTLSYSANELRDDSYEETNGKLLDSNQVFVRDTMSGKYLDYDIDAVKKTYRIAIKLNTKINAQHKISTGTKYIINNYNYNEDLYDYDKNKTVNTLNFKENMSMLRSFANWKFRINEKLTMVSGIHHVYLFLTKENSFEPRIAFKYQANRKNAFTLAYGKHSTMETIANYYAKVENNLGKTTQPNLNLKLLKANHFVAGYNRRLEKKMNAKIELYYQQLYNLPIENNDSSIYATLNETDDFDNLELVNNGKGKNYGIELTIDKFYSQNYYFTFNTSIYNSKYTAGDKIERNTSYNGNFTVNFLIGKEFVGLSKKKNKNLSFNLKTSYSGAKKIIPLLRNSNGELVTDYLGNSSRNYKKAYENGIDNIFQMNFSTSYKVNRPKATHEFSIDIINILNSQGRIYEYYNTNEKDNTGYQRQLPMFPNIFYRIHF